MKLVATDPLPGKTVISWNDTPATPNAKGGTLGTFGSYTFYVDILDFEMDGFTVENTGTPERLAARFDAPRTKLSPASQIAARQLKSSHHPLSPRELPYAHLASCPMPTSRAALLPPREVSAMRLGRTWYSASRASS